LEFLIRIVYNQKIKDATLDSLLLSPVKTFLTAGLLDGNAQEAAN